MLQKIRICDSQNKEIVDLFNRRRILRKKSDDDSKKELEKVENVLADKCAEENVQKIRKEIKGIDPEDGNIASGKLWKLKKKLCPLSRDPPSAMMDPTVNLVTSTEGIHRYSMEHFKKVLENRPIKDHLKQVQN